MKITLEPTLKAKKRMIAPNIMSQDIPQVYNSVKKGLSEGRCLGALRAKKILYTG